LIWINPRPAPKDFYLEASHAHARASLEFLKQIFSRLEREATHFR